MPGERFIGPEKHDSKYDRIKGLIPTPMDDRKELKAMKKEVGNIISDLKKKIKAVPSLADIKDGSGHTVGQILALLQELLVCINDLISGKAASFQGFGVPDVASLRGPYNERMAIYEKLKPSLEAQYKDYKKTIESRPKKNENWVREAQEILKKIDGMEKSIRSIAGEGALKIPEVKQFLSNLASTRKGIEAAITGSDKEGFGREASFFLSLSQDFESRKASFYSLCQEYNASGKIERLEPLKLLQGMGSQKNFRESFDGLFKYLEHEGNSADVYKRALLYFADGIQIRASAFTRNDSSQSRGIWLDIALEGMEGKLSIEISDEGRFFPFPLYGADAEKLSQAYSKFASIIPERFGVKRVLEAAEQKKEIGLKGMKDFAQQVCGMLEKTPGFGQLSGFMFPDIVFGATDEMPLSGNSPAAGCYRQESNTIAINYDYFGRASQKDWQATLCHEFAHALQAHRKKFWLPGQVVPEWINERATDIVSVDIMEGMGIYGITPGEGGFTGYSPSKALWQVRSVVGADAFDAAYLSGDFGAVARKFCMERRGAADEKTLAEFYSIIFSGWKDGRIAEKLSGF